MEKGKEMQNIKWSYMDHWMMDSPQGLVEPSFSVEYMDRYIKQIAGLGFTGFDTFGFRLKRYADLFGSVKKFEKFLQERGMEKISGLFQAYPDASKTRAIHDRSTHDAIFQDCLNIMKDGEGTGAELFIAMPTHTYWQTEPVTDEKIKIIADLWNRIGKMTLEFGVQTTLHHEFWCAIRTMDQLEKFYKWTDPEYVFYYCDTAQHLIAGVDPLESYMKFHDRCNGFHFKDTHNVDNEGEYRLPPDPEMIASSVKRWFWEMGTPEGLVDFPVLMKAIKEYGYKGWIGVEHDKAEVTGDKFSECTCVSRWYIDNVLTKIYK